MDKIRFDAKEQFDSFKALKSGLNEETIIRAAEESRDVGFAEIF